MAAAGSERLRRDNFAQSIHSVNSLRLHSLLVSCKTYHEHGDGVLRGADKSKAHAAAQTYKFIDMWKTVSKVRQQTRPGAACRKFAKGEYSPEKAYPATDSTPVPYLIFVPMMGICKHKASVSREGDERMP